MFKGREDSSDCYACLIPIMKAALEKVGPELEFEPLCSAFSSNLFDQFQKVSQEEAWKTWIEEKVFKRIFFLIRCIA